MKFRDKKNIMQMKTSIKDNCAKEFVYKGISIGKLNVYGLNHLNSGEVFNMEIYMVGCP